MILNSGVTTVQNTITPRSMAEGALLAVITAILALAGAYIPLAHFFTFLVVAVPIIVTVVRNGLSTGIIASVVSAFLVGVLAGPLLAIVFYLQFMIMALVYGYMFKKNKAAGKILLAGTLIAAVTTITLIALTMVIGQVGIEGQKEALFKTVDQTIEIYEDYGMLEQFAEKGIDKEQLRIMLIDSIKLFIRILPALLILGSIFTAITHFVIARITLRRLGQETPRFPLFSEWRLPWYTVWGLIIGWGSYLLGDIYQINFWTILGQNIMIIYGMVLFVLGSSVLSFYFKKYRLSVIGRLLILLLIVMFLPGMVIMTILTGILDLVLDLRKLNQRTKAS